MKISQGFGVLTTCIAVITLCICGRPVNRATARSAVQHSTKHYYDSEEDYDDDYEDYHHEHQQVQPEQPVAMITCYACQYQNELGYDQGSISCKDPFTPAQIATIQCAGPCVKTYRTLDVPGEFFISRNCMPKCKDIRTAKGYTDCCSSHLCNGGAIGTGRYRRRTMAFVAVMLFCCLVLTLT